MIELALVHWKINSHYMFFICLLKGGYKNCLDMKQKTKIQVNGEYQILFAGKNVSIYCHDMNSTLPKEYLTLKAGETENYSEVYGKRLMQPNSCPNNGTRDDNCACVADALRREGLTTFYKVKINVTSLKINSKKIFLHE